MKIWCGINTEDKENKRHEAYYHESRVIDAPEGVCRRTICLATDKFIDKKFTRIK
jgi:hypothetical protein